MMAGPEELRSTDFASRKTTAAVPQWDVIVIGTGLGGSAAAGICASQGLKTLVLEKNPRPGGSCSWYEKDGFHMDIGTHLFIRCNKGPFGECTHRLGLGRTYIPFRTVNPMAYYKALNVDLNVPTRFVQQIPFALQFALQVKIPPTEYLGLLRLMATIFLMREKNIETLDGVSLLDFLHRYTRNPHVLNILGFLMGLYFVAPIWEASAGEAIWNMRHMFMEANLGYPKGGASAIPRAFLTGAQKHGAQVRLNAEVKRIIVEHGRATGVDLGDGQVVSARAVISTSSLKDTMLHLVGPEFLPEGYVERIRRIKSSQIAVQAKIALKKPLIRAGSILGGPPLKISGKLKSILIEDTYRGLEMGRIAGMNPIYGPVPTNYDPDLAPPGCQILTTCAVAPRTDIALADEPQQWIDHMMDAMYAMIPNLKENIIFCDTFSVKNIATWIGKTAAGGGAISTAQTIDQVGRNRHGHHTPIPGLYMAGDCAGPTRGVGTELACQSGMDGADTVVRDMVNGLLA